MAFSFGPKFIGTFLQNVPVGGTFVFRQGGAGSSLCLRAQVGQDDYVAVLATEGVDGELAGPQFFDATHWMGATVFSIADLEFDFAAVAFNLPLPDERSNGSIAVDGQGDHWICLRGSPQVTRGLSYVNLTTGLFGNPDIKAYFPKWRLLWRKPGAEDPIVVATSPQSS